ncbi:MAG: phenylalanine--tRNA ligase subunit beta [Acidimicrobiales bacterium]
MLVPLSWLCDFAPFIADTGVGVARLSRARELAATFDDLGMVVDGMEEVGEGLDDVVVARVLEIAPIPKADRIRRVVVDAGGSEPVQVVCGAWNFEVGDAVVLARVGAVLPGDFAIAARRMKGVASEGMLCSARELGLGAEGAGIMVLDAGSDPGQPVAENLGIYRDVVFDLAIEANRPDAMCVAGVARDGAARLGLPFAIPPVPQSGRHGPAADELASLVVESEDLCPRMIARVLTGISSGSSPQWMRSRLTLAGMRPIGSVVDVSNYVMLELGQPTHPYDLDRLGGQGLIVRQARRSETVITLDGVERRLGEGRIAAAEAADCVICDAEDQVVGLAGIMGGSSSEITGDTSRVLLEVAHFAPMAIARTSKRLGLRTEASARFERGCDPDGLERAADRFCELLGQCGPVQVSPGFLEGGVGVPPREHVVVRTERVNAILGTVLGDDEIASLLKPIGFEAHPKAPGRTEFEVPGFRPDVEREIDLIEEVGRHHGYSKVARLVPCPPQVGGLTPYQRDRRRVAQVMAGLGASEAQTPTLLAPSDHERIGLGDEPGSSGGAVRLTNPMVGDESVLRRTMMAGLLKAAAFNVDRRWEDVRLFEIGHVFEAPKSPGGDPGEYEHLALLMGHPGDDVTSAVLSWRRMVEALGAGPTRMQASSWPGLHPGRSVELVVGGAIVGGLGEIDPDVAAAFGLGGRRLGYFECDLELVLARGDGPGQAGPGQAVGVSAFPSSDIDLAFEVDESVPAELIRDALAQAGGELLVSLELFDVYRGPGIDPGRRSLAFRLRFCSLERTLTDVDVADLRRGCIQAVESGHGARLRI